MIFLPFSGKKNNYVIGNWNYFCHFNIRHPVFYTVEEGSWINSYLDALNCGLMVANGAIEVWQYGLWSFQTRDKGLSVKEDYDYLWAVHSFDVETFEFSATFILWFAFTKLERFLPRNQHTQRKLLNFENWVNGEVSKIGHQVIVKTAVIKKFQ